jgi:hypothetical protein
MNHSEDSNEVVNLSNTLTHHANEFMQMLSKQNLNRFFNKSFNQHSYRNYLIFEFLFPLAKKFHFSQLTFIVGVSLFDSVISKFILSKIKMEKIAFLCLSISSKIHEVHPLYCSRVHIFPFSEKEFNNLEKLILETLDFRVNTVTHFHFVTQSLKFYSENQIDQETLNSFQKFKSAIYDLCIIILSNYSIYEYTPISLSMSLFLIVNKTFDSNFQLPLIVHEITQIKNTNLDDCVSSILKIIKEYYLKQQSEKSRIIKSIQEKSCSKIEQRSFLSIDN